LKGSAGAEQMFLRLNPPMEARWTPVSGQATGE
jgi:hypothetical protein